MTTPTDPSQNKIKTHKMPEHSLFYDKIVPGLFIILGIIMIVIIVLALGILTNVISWH